MALPTVAELARWVGGARVSTDVVAPDRARALAATLDLPEQALADGSPLPPGWHWIYFHGRAPRSSLGPDGHEARGTFLPDLPGAQRMWAGGRLRFARTLRLGDEAERVSTVRSIEAKEGRSGPLVFVDVVHRISTRGLLAVEEVQSLVYRLPGLPGPDGATAGDHGARAARPSPDPSSRPTPAPDASTEAAWHERLTTDEVLLFRFSALTFNGHRIHYDHPYATSVEGYPGLVVHGPLVALLLLGAGARRAGPARVERFRFRAVRPVFCGDELTLSGGPFRPGVRAGGEAGVAGGSSETVRDEDGDPAGSSGTARGGPRPEMPLREMRLRALGPNGAVATEADLVVRPGPE